MQSREMKQLIGVIAVSCTVAGVCLGSLLHLPTRWNHDNQVAAGEWKIELQTPPCDSIHNLQVIWPAHSGEPATIECDLMPVGER